MHFAVYLDKIDLIGILMIVVISLAAVAIFILFLLYGLNNRGHSKYMKQLSESSNSFRVFRLDVKNDIVSYFSSNNLRGRKTINITSFYHQFDAIERERLINWIGELLDDEFDPPKFLEIHVVFRNSKRTVPSILQVEKVDRRKQLIYLESRILYLNEKQPKKKGEKRAFLDKNAFVKSLTSLTGKGSTFCVNIFNKITKSSDFSRLAYVDLKNIILSFANQNTFVTEHEFGKLIIATSIANSRLEQFAFADSIKTKINKFLLIKAFADEISYTIGVIENKVKIRSINGLINNVVNLSEIAKDSSDQIVYYDKQSPLIEEQAQQYRTDVETIIQDNKLNYYFQPIYDVDRRKIIAYVSSVVPIDSYFKNIDDLKNYAQRTEDDKELFSTIVKNTISRFVEEKEDEDVKLFMPISYNEINFVNRSLGHTARIGDANIVLVLKEQELANIPSDYGEDAIINSIRSFKSKGYQVALQIDADLLTLSSKLYSLFDYFNLSVTSHITKRSAGTQLPSFQGLIEKLLHYKTPIVATNIISWEIVELVYRLGISSICSDAIALPQENIMPLPRKMIMKINNLKS